MAPKEKHDRSQSGNRTSQTSPLGLSATFGKILRLTPTITAKGRSRCRRPSMNHETGRPPVLPSRRLALCCRQPYPHGLTLR